MVPSAGGRRTRVATGRHVVSKRGASGPPGLTRRGDRLDQVALTVFP